MLADHSKSRFGRRRPFIVISAALCCAATLLFGYARPIATLFTSSGSSSVRALFQFQQINRRISIWLCQTDSLTIWFAVLSIYCIDFSINAGLSMSILNVA